MHLKSLKKNRKSSTCIRSELETLGSPPILSKDLPEDDHQRHASYVVRRQELSKSRLEYRAGAVQTLRSNRKYSSRFSRPIPGRGTTAHMGGYPETLLLSIFFCSNGCGIPD